MSYRPPKKPTLALETDIVQDNIPAEVYPNIYIGSIHAAFNQEILLNLGITHILNASRLPSTFPKSFTYLSIDIRDKDEANILACIPAANIFIEAGIESGGVMVHCYGGRSRSAALVAAFLMSSFDWSYSKSLQTIQAARPVAHINRGFEIQLKAYVHAKYDVYLAQQVLLQGRVRALQCYRSIEGNTADELLIKENERKKFGSLHTVGSNGYASSRRKNSPYNPHNNRPGSKRSWGNAKDEDETETEDHNDSGSSSEDAEEEDNLMESAVKSYHTNHPLDRTKESYNSQKLNKTPFSAISSSSSSLLLTNNTPSHNHHIINSSSNNYLTSPRTPLNNNNNNSNCNGNGNGSTTIHLLASNDNSNNISNINNININNNNNSSYQYVDHSQTTNSTKLRQHIPLMDPRSPRLRLSRPGSTSVRVIPPLRGLERVFCCSWCHCQLFNLASVIRTDVKVDPLPDHSSNWADEKDDSHTTHKLHSSSSSSSNSVTSFSNHVNIIQASPRGSSKMTAPSSQEKESTYLMPAPSPRGSNISFSNVTYPDDAKLSSTYLSPDKFGINKNNSNTNVINNCYSYGFDDIGLNVSNSSVGGVANTSRRNSEYKSPPKTSRSKGAKTFDFDIFSDDSNNFKSNHNGDNHNGVNRNNNNNHENDNDEETSTLKSVSEIPIFQNNNYNNNINNNNNNTNNTNTINNELNENRVSSPMEISDEKQLSSHNETNINIYTKEVDEKQYLNESTTLSLSSPSLSLSRRSSKNHFRLQVSSEGLFNKDESHQQQQHQHQHSNIINSSRPSSSNSVNSNNSRQRENILSLPSSLSRNSSIQQIQQQQQPPLSPTESPRIVFPHEPRESYAYPSPRNRPQSAEKRRWLERVNLLKSDSSSAKFEHNDHLLSNNTNNNNNTNFNSNSYDNTRIKKHDEKVTKLSQDDDEAIKLGFGRDKYIYLEYLEWMGEELLSSSINSGDLKCNHCSHIIGSWSWTPNYRQTLNGILQVPIIKVHKNVIHEVDVPLDQTPLNTPRIDDQMEDGNANI